MAITELLKPTKEQTNALGYLEIEVDKVLRPIGNKILLQWEQNTDFIKAGTAKLIRPENFKKAHYTGIVLKVGLDVTLDIEIGMRIFFEQFAGFEKLFDPKYGRLALIRDTDAIAVVPPRAKIESDGGDYDFDQ